MRNAQTGRRRGRSNNPRPQQGGREIGNRSMEPRQRGNALQLLEKYSNLAREAHQQGERVQAEYYLQYADHYHRVVAEMRARQDERQAQQPQQPQQQGERQRRDRDDREERDERDDRYARGQQDESYDDDSQGDDDDIAESAPEPRRQPARDDEGDDEGALRTLSRSARQFDSDDGQPENEARGDGAAERPRRGRGRPRRAPRDEQSSGAEREPVDA